MSWQWLALAAGPSGAQWQWLRVEAESGAVTTPTAWQWLRLDVSASTVSYFVLPHANPFDAGEDITITATRNGAAPTGRVWRVASGTATLTPNGDTVTLRAPIGAVDSSVTIGYKPSDAAEIFVTLNFLRATDWVKVGTVLKPAIWHVVDDGAADLDAAFAAAFRGVNLSGAEFTPDAAHLPGVVNTDYMYPTQADYTYIAGRGHKLVRLPIRWERIQPTRGAALDSAQLSMLTTAISRANTAGLKVLVDIHNYARYINSTANGGAELVLGGGVLTNAHLADLWTLLSTALRGLPGLAGYGLMNEPHSLPGLAGSFTATSTPFSFDATVQSWTVETSGTVARSTTTVHDGSGSLQITRTLAAGSNQLIRANDAATNTLDFSNGATIAAWVLVPSGAPGTNWQARLEMQDSAFTWQTGAYTALTPGTWAQLSFTPSGAIWTGHKGIGVQFTSTQSTAPSVSVYVDTVQQGSLTGTLTPAQQWQAASQEVVTAIRAGGDTTRILIPGYQFSGAQNWPTNHPSAWISDPADNIAYEAHYYMDRDNSGTYVNTYASEETDATSRGFSSLTARAVTEITRFTDWCVANNVRGFIGEIGWPNNVSTASWNAVAEAVYDVLDVANIGAAYWAAGSWYGTTYNLSAYTGTPLATTASPSTIIEAHVLA
jgi:hypothetical protein